MSKLLLGPLCRRAVLSGALLLALGGVSAQAVSFNAPRVYPGVNGVRLSGRLASGDFNRDGKLDLVSAEGTFVLIVLGNGDGTFGP